MDDSATNDIIVLIPHFNNPAGLLKSIDSIDEKEQLDVLIVDDGSNKQFDPVQIKQSYRAKGKVHFIYLEKNQGIEQALNAGLKFAVDNGKYNYVARLDCGDMCIPGRFHIQKQFLILNPEIYLIGSAVEFINMNGDFMYHLDLPTKHEEIKKKMYFNCMFIHPSVMFRTEAVKEKVGYYPIKYEAAEDYAFFFKFLNHYKTANLSKALVKCELNPNGLSRQKRKKQVISRIKVIFKNFKFNYYAIAGIFRNTILLLLPFGFIMLLKKTIWNGR